jgi:hypothetical protein
MRVIEVKLKRCGHTKIDADYRADRLVGRVHHSANRGED